MKTYVLTKTDDAEALFEFDNSNEAVAFRDLARAQGAEARRVYLKHNPFSFLFRS